MPKKTEIEKETGVSNETRVKWARRATAAYLKGKAEEEPDDSEIIDLMADLFHLAEACGQDPDSLYRKAWGHYEYESKLGKVKA